MAEVVQYRSHVGEQITLSEAAQRHILTYLNKVPHSMGVRFSVKKTGCSGFSYDVEYVESPKENDIAQPLSTRYQIFIDKNSYPYLKGMHVDYVQEGLNYKFVFSNPNQKGQCGCGESFSVD
jgi:iron-sulfur cluster assembly accessory protein